MQLRSHVDMAVVLASGYSSNSTPSLGTSICHSWGPKKKKKKKKKNNEKSSYLTETIMHIFDVKLYYCNKSELVLFIFKAILGLLIYLFIHLFDNLVIDH